MEEFDYKEYISLLDIKDGDILDVASDLMSIMLYCREEHLKFDANHLIDALCEAVGEEGTVMIRTFNWDFCHGVPFDIKNTPSRVGSLGNIALKREDFVRTHHPIYSWMVKGKYKDELVANDEKKAFGEGSIFEFLYKNHAKFIRIGNIDETVFTDAHYAECIVGVPYRFEKEFTAEYIDENDNKTNRTYSMYVRYLDYECFFGILPHIYDKWIEHNIIQDVVWNERLKISVINIFEGVHYMIDDLRNNNGENVCVINGHSGYTFAINHPMKQK